MIGCLPGTTIETDLEKNDASTILSNIFMTGGLVLSQVAQLANIEPHTVHNWVKRGFLTPPIDKKYSKKQFCRIVTINMLKDCLPLNEVTRLLSYINGHLNDDSDDMIDDDKLYLLLVTLISEMRHFSERAANEAINHVLEGFEEPFAGARERLKNALMIMGYAYYSTLYSRKAAICMSSLDL